MRPHNTVVRQGCNYKIRTAVATSGDYECQNLLSNVIRLFIDVFENMSI